MAFCSQNRRATKLRYTPRNLTEREGIEPTNLILEIKILPLNYLSFKFLSNIKKLIHNLIKIMKRIELLL